MFRRGLSLLRSSSSGGEGSLLRSSAIGGLGSLLRSSPSGGAGAMPRSVASGGGGPLLLPRLMATGVSTSRGGARPGHKALLATLSIVASVSAATVLMNKGGDSASSESEEVAEEDFLFPFVGLETAAAEALHEFVDWELQGAVLETAEEDALPEFVDWELEGAVNVPRDQGNCGSCWAHSAVGAIEGLHQIVWGELLNLSVQSVIDCAQRMNSRGMMVPGWGCGGGRIKDAFAYAKNLA